MATKKEWSLYLKERKKFEKAYAKQTIKLEKQLAKLPDGEVTTMDAPIETPPKPPVNP